MCILWYLFFPIKNIFRKKSDGDVTITTRNNMALWSIRDCVSVHVSYSCRKSSFRRCSSTNTITNVLQVVFHCFSIILFDFFSGNRFSISNWKNASSNHISLIWLLREKKTNQNDSLWFFCKNILFESSIVKLRKTVSYFITWMIKYKYKFNRHIPWNVRKSGSGWKNSASIHGKIWA